MLHCVCVCMCVCAEMIHNHYTIHNKREISIINHTLHVTIETVIGTLTCMSMASNRTSNRECY